MDFGVEAGRHYISVRFHDIIPNGFHDFPHYPRKQQQCSNINNINVLAMAVYVTDQVGHMKTLKIIKTEKK